MDGTEHRSPRDARRHEIAVTGLSPATSYDYQVHADGTVVRGRFTTAPARPSAPVRFAVLGDTRSGHDAHRRVVDAIRAEGPIGLLFNTGDIVESGDDDGQWQAFFDVQQPLLASVPWYPVVGNHELAGGKLPPAYYEYVAPPTDSSGNEAYYSFTHGNTAFLVLDGYEHVERQALGLWTDFDQAQHRWLASALAGYAADPTIQHRFVLHHAPPYSSMSGRTGSHALRLLLPLFATHRVDGIIAGHDHYLERGESPGGTHYIVMGGGGAPLYQNDSEGKPGYQPPVALPWLDDEHTVHFAKRSHGYLLVTICDGQVDASIKDDTGALLDRFSWNTGDLAAGRCGAGDGGASPRAAVQPTGTPPSPADSARASAASRPGRTGPAASGSDCGCRHRGPPSPTPSWWYLLGAAALWGRRRSLPSRSYCRGGRRR